MKKIHALKQQIPICTVTIWVKSHQDDSVPVESLSFAAKLNCQADALATSQYYPAFVKDTSYGDIWQETRKIQTTK
jgi:hypothetical protein